MAKTIFPGFGGSQSKMQSAGRAKTGGGARMNKNVSVGVKGGKPAQGVSPAAAASIGLQRITTTGYRDGAPNPKSVPLGNATAKAAGQGPGAGRAVHRAGSQQCGPTAKPMTSANPNSWPWGK
jgi:hypothetical protein